MNPRSREGKSIFRAVFGLALLGFLFSAAPAAIPDNAPGEVKEGHGQALPPTLDPEGNVAEAKMRAVSPETDFSFDFHDLLLKPLKLAREK